MRICFKLSILILALVCLSEYEANEAKLINNGKKNQKETDPASRLINLKEHIQAIKAHNSLHDKGEVSYRMRLNHLSKYSFEDFEKKYLRRKKAGKSKKPVKRLENKKVDTSSLPLQMSWLESKKLTPVRDQGECGSCWAFATIGALESKYLIKTGKSIDLSEQQLVDCTYFEDISDPNYEKYGNDACDGGSEVTAMEYIKLFGVEAEKNYPYISKYGYFDDKCLRNPKLEQVKIKGWENSEYNSDEELMEKLKDGPVNVALHVVQDFMHYYKGIYNSNTCDSNEYTCGDKLNHAVLLVGYGEEDGQKYWLIKNSWSAKWGEEGYVRIIRGKNMCCMNADVTVLKL